MGASLWAGQVMADQIVNENYTIQGSQCVGYDCVNNEVFGSNVLRLKENNNRIRFWDSISNQTDIQSFELKANDTANGGENYFSFEHSVVLPVYGDGVTIGFDAEGNQRVIGVDEQLYSFENGGSYNYINLAPVWSYENSAILKFKKNVKNGIITLGQGSTEVDGAVSIGSDSLMRKIKYVAQGLADSDILITGLINHYDPIKNQKLDVSEVQAQLDLLAAQLTELEDWVSGAELQDTDGDGENDYIDSDDDGDGVPDINDAFPFNKNEQLDNDGDGKGDNADLDDDNDNVLDVNDAFPFDANEQLDSDGDGIGNNADTDDDNDGIPDSIENGDFNGDGINDSQQVEADITSFGAGSLSYGYLLLGLLLIRKRTLIPLLGVFSLSFNTHANTDTCLSWVIEKPAQCFYFGLGSGTSSLQTDTDSTGWKSEDGANLNLSVFLGRVLTENWSAQVGFSQLGSSELTHKNPAITQAQSIDFDAKYLKAVRSLWQKDGRFSVAANGGLAWLTSKASSGINLAEEETIKATFGLTADWRINQPWQAQAQVNHYMGTASVFNLALVYHFEPSSSMLMASTDHNDSYTQELELSDIALIVEAPQSCEVLSGTQLTLYFDNSSNELSDQAQDQLSNWWTSLEHPDHIEFMIEGHSDKQGTALNNLKFSKQRAQNVAGLLTKKGFPENQLRGDGSGEFNLASKNDANLNRRVDIWVLRDNHCDIQAEEKLIEAFVESDKLH